MTEPAPPEARVGTTSTATWVVMTASVRGASHERDGRPNQDAVRASTLADVDGELVALSDGHGGARYVRSEVGSQQAVDVAVELTATWWTDRGQHQPPEQLSHAIKAELLPTIVETWQRRCLEHLAQSPFTDEEVSRAGVSSMDDEPTVAYGATLLVALLAVDVVVLLQLGDGDVVVAATTGSALQPIPADDRLVGGQTTSLCLANAVDDFRISVLHADEVGDLVVLASDGYGNSFADPSWPDRVLEDLRVQFGRRGHDAIATDLPGWLRESAQAAGDDVTVAVARHVARSSDETPRALGPLPTTRQAVPYPDPARGLDPEPVPPPRRRWLLMVGVALLGLAAGVVLGLVLSSDDPAEEPAATSASTSTSVATTPSTQTSTVVPPPPDPATATVAGPQGNLVQFDLVPDAPRPRKAGPVDAASPGRVVEVLLGNGERWRVTDTGALEYLPVGSTSWVGIDPGGTLAATIHAEAGTLWVVDRDERTLTVVDPVTRAVVNQAEIADEPPQQGSG